MKTSLLFCGMIPVLLSSCAVHEDDYAFARPVKTERERIHAGLRLGNRYWELAVLPDSAGRIASITALPEQAELLSPYQESYISGNPLFVVSNNNARGIREVFWGQSAVLKNSSPMTLNRTDGRSYALLTSRNYANSVWSMSKYISLPPDSCVCDVVLRLMNRSGGKASVMIWLNQVPSAGSLPLFPARGGVNQIYQRRGITYSPHDAISHGAYLEFFAQPAANWSAIRSGQNKIWAFIFHPGDLQPGGFLYGWQGIQKGEKIATSELVFSRITAGPGGERHLNYRIAYFPKLDNLNAVFSAPGSGEAIGVQAAVEAGKLTLRFNAAIPSGKEQPVELREGNRVISLFRLPELTPEKDWKHTVALPEKCNTDNLSLRFDGGQCKLIIRELKK